MADRTWIAAHEGYYGPPLRHEKRLELYFDRCDGKADRRHRQLSQ